MPTEEEFKQVSKYNDAFFSISRLHDHWLKCNKYIRSGQFNAWKNELDSIWLELITDVHRQKNKIDLIEKNCRLMKNIAESTNRIKLFFNLMERHSFLRQVQDAAGKAGDYRDENEEGFE